MSLVWAVGVVWVIKKHDAPACKWNKVAAVRLLKNPLIEHELCRAVRNHPLCEGDHIVEALCGAGEIVRGGDDRAASRRLGVEDVHDLLLGRRIDARHWLVKQIDLRIGGDGTRQEDPAPLTTRKLADLSLCKVGHIDTLQRVSHRSAIGSARSTKWTERWRTTHHYHFINRNREAPINLLGLRHIRNTLRMNADR
jgi:hypothetical protein